MFIITRGSVNKIILTLTEKSTLSTPTYLFEFTHDITRQSVIFISHDTSLYKSRYNSFLITETSGVNDFLNGVITLPSTDFYSYRVFEQSSTTNLLISNTGAMVENGKFIITATVTSSSSYDNQPKQYVEYVN